MNKILLGLILTLLGMGPALATNVWHYNAPVERIYPVSTGSATDTTVIVSFTTNSPSCTASGSGANKLYYIKVGQSSVTAESLKNMLAVLMLAKSLGKEVAVLFDDSTVNCYVKQLYIE